MDDNYELNVLFGLIPEAQNGDSTSQRDEFKHNENSNINNLIDGAKYLYPQAGVD